LQDGLLWYKKFWLYVPKERFRDVLLKECHDGPLAGHGGYHDLSLGLATNARAWKGVGWEGNPIVTFTFTFLRVKESVRE